MEGIGYHGDSFTTSTEQPDYSCYGNAYYDSQNHMIKTETQVPTLTQLVKWGLTPDEQDTGFDTVYQGSRGTAVPPRVEPTCELPGVVEGPYDAVMGCDVTLDHCDMIPNRFDNDISYTMANASSASDPVSMETTGWDGYYQVTYDTAAQYDTKPRILSQNHQQPPKRDIDILSGGQYMTRQPLQRFLNSLSVNNPHSTIFIREVKGYTKPTARYNKHRMSETGKRKYVKRMSNEEQIQNGNNLWQFLMRLLMTKPEVIAWTGNDLEFKIVNKDEVARLWGKIKNRERMNFDKFSRALRYYYDKRILIHNPSSRLTYCFMRNPRDPVFCTMLQDAMRTLPANRNTCNAYCDNASHQHELQYEKRKVRPTNSSRTTTAAIMSNNSSSSSSL